MEKSIPAAVVWRKPRGSLPLRLRGAPAFGILRKGEAGYISTGRIYFYFLNNCKMSHLAPPQSAAHQQGASRGAASASAANKPRTTAAASPPEEPAGGDAAATLPGTIPIPTCGDNPGHLCSYKKKKKIPKCEPPGASWCVGWQSVQAGGCTDRASRG